MPLQSSPRRKPAAMVLLKVAVAMLSYAGSVHCLKKCPPCGNSSVPYPFSTSSDCGEQGYKIQCDGGALMFPTTNNSYPITSISPSTQRLVVSPAPFLPNTCVTSDISTIGMELNATAPFNITSSNTIMFLNCTESLLRSPLSCSSDSLCHVYVNATREAAACVDAPICCTFKAGGSTTSYSIRVRNAGCRAYRSFVNLDTTQPASDWGRPGVEIQWVLPQEPECATQADCDGIPRNATCTADTTSPGISRCFCDSGLFWDSINGLCAQNDVNLAVYVKRLADEERIMDVVDLEIKAKANSLELDTMKALGYLALGCLEERRQNRPSMKEVTEEIEYIMSIATAREEDHISSSTQLCSS